MMMILDTQALLSLWHTFRYPILATVVLIAVLWKWSRIADRSGFESTKIYDTEKLSTASDASRRVVKQKADPIVKRTTPIRTVTGQKPVKAVSSIKTDTTRAIQPVIFYATVAGATEDYAKSLASELTKSTASTSSAAVAPILEPEVLDLSELELDDYFISTPKGSPNTDNFYIILFPTYNIDTNLSNFLDHLQETHYDFRVDTAPLSGLLGYAVLGFGDKEGWPSEEEGFCSQAKQADQWLAKLTSQKRAYPLGTIDVKARDVDARMQDWTVGITSVLNDLSVGKGLGDGVPGSGEALESDEEDDAENRGTSRVRSRSSKVRQAKSGKSTNLDDLENLGSSFRGSAAAVRLRETASSPVPIDFTTTSSLPATTIAKPMVPQTSPTYTALTKQGYTIVGTHSGVKICRWTKSALRGRGSCYKHSFYGIASHTCMEATPSLSCSNKCVFCWRHGTNPVGTTWRWEVNPPEEIFAGIKQGHYSKIKMLRGVPGVRAERFEEAMRIRHCALSLVGEPIFYPHINELLGMLHNERISSFLVCNAQHPAQLRTLAPVTQLYLSIDAADAATLRKIDRPLHRDYWQRFLDCLDIVREKRHIQRTVYRLTLVKGFNVETEAQGYADLVAKGLPCFVEVKGVTYCGTSTSKSAGLTMGNVPFYEEVVAFVEALERACKERGLDYGIAAEHAHSCCILLAQRKRFYKEGTWWTNIDYQGFFDRLESGECNGGVRPEEYMAKTPEWALWGKGGFDPRDERVKKGKKAREQKREAQERLLESTIGEERTS